MLNVEEEAYIDNEILHQQEISPPPAYETNWFPNQTSLPPYSSNV